MSRFLDELRRRVLVFDGAMGTSIHRLSLDLHEDYLGRENCTEVLVLTRPEVIQAIHESFLAAGADAVETDTFGANQLVLAEFDLADRTRELNRRAAEVARAACARFSCGDQPRFVVGSIGPGTKLITLGNTDWDTLFASYREQARGLLDGGIDVFLIETAQDLLQLKCAINACLAALGEARKTPDDVPLMVQVTIETSGTMLLGTEIAAAATALLPFPIASLGLNCATGPAEMTEHVQWLSRHWPRAISVLPNAGLPVLKDGHAEFPLQPQPFAAAMRRFVEELGVNVVGGCCGTTPAHIAELAKLVGRRAPAARPIEPAKPACSSLYNPVEFRQDTSILNIGERTNASGSRAFKKLLEVEDWDGMISLAREQAREGSHVIDINVDYAGRDNARDMAELVHRCVRQVNVPLMLDSTQPATLEAGLRQAGGKCIINSANLEDGEAKFARMVALARQYGAALVLGTIDEDKEEAMARTAERKLAIARRMYDLAVNRHGLAPEDILFDPLVLPISTGMEKDRRSALETIEGVRRIAREFPPCQITCGLSNVSFGLKPAARVVLNSAFQHELVEAGLTSAIVHVSKILPRTKIPDAQWNAALDLIYDRRDQGDPLQRFIALFPGEERQDQNAPPPAAALPLEERLQRHIIDGEKRDLIATLEAARAKYPPLDIINNHLLAGMKVVGDLFGSGQMQLPFVLQSAEVMKMAVGHLEQYMEKTGGQSKGTLVLATVKGDVHDIGKNLVDIILSNNGYTVHNLGIKQPIAAVLAKAKEVRADAIGLSGLLVKSVGVMKESLEELSAQGITTPVLLGGAALSRHYCEHDLRRIRGGGVYYGRDAFEGLRIMDLLRSGREPELNAEIDARLTKRAEVEAKLSVPLPSEGEGGRRPRRPGEGEATPVEAVSVAVVSSDEDPHPNPLPRKGEGVRPCHPTHAAPSAIRRDVPVPTPPFWGTRVVEAIDLDGVFAYINKVALFRGQWQFKKGRQSDADYERQVREEIEPLFAKLCAQCKTEGILQPKVVYGYFPCNASAPAPGGNDLIVYDPDQPDREIERFTFPRQSGRQHLCISDFFRPPESAESGGSGVRDVLGLSCVTMGARASEVTKALFAGNQYTQYLYLHGLSVESAEALAELWHKTMRAELGIAGDDSPHVRELFTQHYRGSRYSFGYPACPDLSDQAKLFRLLRPERISCTLTENFQIDPEQSTSAMVVHHPDAKYFAV